MMINVNYFVRENCRLCNHPDLKLVVNFPPTVSGNRLKKSPDAPDPELVPIDLYQCQQCGHVQVIHVPPPNSLYGEDYPFMPGNNPVLIKHFEETVKDFTQNFISEVKFALEIGSNDGIFLEKMRDVTGCRVLGVDPSLPPVEMARKRCVETILDFFSPDIAERIIEQYGHPDVVIANNVFAHIDDQRGVIKGIQTLLPEGGYFIFEISYLKDVVEKFLIGTVIHEHLSVHSLTSLIPCLQEFDLVLKKAHYVNHVQGGAIVGVCQKSSSARSEVLPLEIQEMIDAEAASGITSISGMRNFNTNLHQKLSLFKQRIISASENRRIIGYGSAVSAPIIIDLLDLRNKIEYVIDDNPFKKGKYMPIGNIPIIGSENFPYDPKDTLFVILGWAQTERIFKNLRHKFFGSLVATIYTDFEIKEVQ